MRLLQLAALGFGSAVAETTCHGSQGFSTVGEVISQEFGGALTVFDCCTRCFDERQDCVAVDLDASGKNRACVYYRTAVGTTAKTGWTALARGSTPTPTTTPTPPTSQPPPPSGTWQVAAGKMIKENTWVDLVNATLLHTVRDACYGPFFEPDCGIGPPGVPSATTGCPENQREGCFADGPVHTDWCHPPGAYNSDGIDPITGMAQVLDDVEAEGVPSGALCKNHCEHWETYNVINNGSNPPRLSDCHVSFGCQAWTWTGTTCFFHMVTPTMIGSESWDSHLADCSSCVSGFKSGSDAVFMAV